MRQAGSLATESEAQLLCDYLLANGIEARFAPDDDGRFALWVVEESELGRVREELARFVREPADPRYRGSVASAERIRQRTEQEQDAARRRYIDVRTQWHRTQTRTMPVTLALIGICVGVGLLTRLGSGSSPLQVALMMLPGRVVGDYIHYVQGWSGLQALLTSGEVWRFVTPIFLHMGIFHLLFNMFWLYELGGIIEARRGRIRLVLLVLVIAILSNMTQFLVGGPSFGGMSGVIYGLFGYAWLKGRFEPHLGVGVSQSTVTVLLVWFGICFLGIFPIANGAHTGGLVSGCVIGGAKHVWERLRRGAP